MNLQINPFTNLRNIAMSAEPRVSFWGKRYMILNGSENVKLSIDYLTKQAFDLIRNYPHFSESERVPARELATRIDFMYDESDRLVNQSNWITYLFARIRDLFERLTTFKTPPYGVPSSHCSVARWHWRDCESKYDGESIRQIFYVFYTQPQYEAAFGSHPPEFDVEIHRPGHGTKLSPACFCLNDSFGRWLAPG